MKQDQVSLNKRIEQLLLESKLSKKTLSPEEIAFIQTYEGSGGQASKGATGEGLLHEFYTPDYVVELLWELAKRFGYDGGNILEPSIATGRMLKYAPKEATCVGFEINAVSAEIARLTYPNAIIHKGFFETAFLEAPRFTKRIQKGFTWLNEYPFSLVIGNPPYGKYKNAYSSYFPSPAMAQIEMFFIYYGLLLLKSGGLLIYVISSNFLRNGNTYDKTKLEIEKIAVIEDAYRLPPVFKSSQVPVDIIVLRKK